MTRCFVLGVVASVLVGCAGPRPGRPDSAVTVAPPAWLGRTNGDALETPAVWISSFGDPVLTRIVDASLANNVDLSIAAARVAESRAQYRLARAQRSVNITGAVAGGRERSINPAFGFADEQTAGQAEVSIAYDTDLFGRLAQASAAAKAALLASEAGRETVRIAVLAAAAESYINLRALDERLRILEQTLAARDAEVRFTRRRTSVGYSAAIDLQQAQAAYRATEQLIPGVTLLIARQEHALSLLLGENPRAIERGSTIAELRQPVRATVVPSELLVRRPDLIQAEQQLIAADRSLDAARAAFMPAVQLRASGSYVASTLLENDPIRVFSLGGSVLAPLFDSGRLRAQQNIAAARRDQAAFAYRRAALGAFREVEDALAAVERNKQQLLSVEAQRDDLARILDLATKRYRAGYSPYIEQLDAQRGLLSAELAAVQVRADLLNSAIALYRSVGAGWRSP